MLAGFGVRDITPAPGLSMAGFAVRDGPPTALGTHDSLYVRSLGVKSGGVTVLLFAFDLIGLPSAWIAQAREAVERECGVQGVSQMFTCTHTHCGPGTGVIPYTLGNKPACDPAYMDALMAEVVLAGCAALDSVESTKLRVAQGESYGGWNRRSAEASATGPCDGHVDDIDPSLVVAQFERPDGSLVGTVMNYGCHPTASRASYYSSDYPGYLRTMVEAHTAAPCIYVNGAGGDVNPRLATSDFRSFELAEYTGERLGQDVLEVLNHTSLVESTTIGAATSVADLVFANLISEESAERIHAEGDAAYRQMCALEDEDMGAHLSTPTVICGSASDRAFVDAKWSKMDYAERVLTALRDKGWSDRIQVEVQVLRIGDLAIAAFPSEFFSADGRSVRGESPARYNMVAGWSNGLFGYTPTRRAVDTGGYEADSAFKIYGYPAVFDPVSGANLRAAALEATCRLFD